MAVLSWEQVAAVALKAGWPPGDAVIAAAITQPESSRDASAIQAGQPYATTGWGLWQITPGNSVPRFGIDRQLLDPLNNARAGHWKWEQAGGFAPWTTYENGLELPYVPAAQTAVAHVTHLSAAELDRLVAEARAAAPGGGAQTGQVSDWSPIVRRGADHAGRTAARMHATGRVIRSLRPGRVSPAVTVPDPAGLLWRPGQPLPRPGGGQ